jgi:hypothetical protein
MSSADFEKNRRGQRIVGDRDREEKAPGDREREGKEKS